MVSTFFFSFISDQIPFEIPFAQSALSGLSKLVRHGLGLSQFKIAKVMAVFKKGGNSENLNDYIFLNILLVFR